MGTQSASEGSLRTSRAGQRKIQRKSKEKGQVNVHKQKPYEVTENPVREKIGGAQFTVRKEKRMRGVRSGNQGNNLIGGLSSPREGNGKKGNC